ncbi:MAG TPA: hypothetical protein VH988_31020 [Thermoanaerobaculia bacterium]|jgi:hypothetical protein|nr:hypothetical protein [Thermoanaerobaculia bacterium]
MPRRPKRLIVPVFALIALVFLFPALATAAPRQGETSRPPAARHEAVPSLFVQLRSLLAVLWQTGSGLEPNGGKPGEPNATTSGDNGSGLEPDGRL